MRKDELTQIRKDVMSAVRQLRNSPKGTYQVDSTTVFDMGIKCYPVHIGVNPTQPYDTAAEPDWSQVGVEITGEGPAPIEESEWDALADLSPLISFENYHEPEPLGSRQMWGADFIVNFEKPPVDDDDLSEMIMHNAKASEGYKSEVLEDA